MLSTSLAAVTFNLYSFINPCRKFYVQDNFIVTLNEKEKNKKYRINSFIKFKELCNLKYHKITFDFLESLLR